MTTWADAASRIAKEDRTLAANALLCVLAAALVYVLTSTRQKARGYERPPVVRSWVPILNSALEFGKDPDGFLVRNTAKYGDIWAAKIGPKKLIHVTSPIVINNVYKDPSTFTFIPIRLQFSIQCFGMSDRVFDSMQKEFFPVHHRGLSKNALGPLVSSYVDSLVAAFEGFMASVPSQGATLQLKGPLLSLLYGSSARAFFGPHFPTSSADDFWEFDSWFPFMAVGLPSFTIRKGIEARTRLGQTMKDYLGKYGDEDTGRIEGAFELVNDIIQLTRRFDWPATQLHASLVSDLWALEANAPWVAFWVVVILYQEPTLLAQLRSELERAEQTYFGERTEDVRFADLLKDVSALDSLFPLLTSTIDEVLRMCISAASIRLVTKEATIAGSVPCSPSPSPSPSPSSTSTSIQKTYALQKGDIVMCSTRMTHVDTGVHDRPEAFMPDRFLGNPKFRKDGKVISNPTMPFGGGVSKCEGRFFATLELRIFTLYCLRHLDLSISDLVDEKGRHVEGDLVPVLDRQPYPPGEEEAGAETETETETETEKGRRPRAARTIRLPAFDPSRAGLGAAQTKGDVKAFVRRRRGGGQRGE